MKKFVMMLLGIAVAMNAAAVTYTAKATLTLQSTSGFDCELTLRQSNEYGALNGYDMYIDSWVVALYALNGTTPLEVAMAQDLDNLALGLKVDGSDSYTINVSNVAGTETLYLYDGENVACALENNASYVFTADANTESRFTIRKASAPAPDYGSYQRNVTVGNYGTICLPKAGTIAGGTLFNIGSYENNMIYIDEVSSVEMEAGKPYIFEASADQIIVTYTSDVVVNEADHANGLYGNYDLNDASAIFNVPEGDYILYNNLYWEVVSARPAKLYNYFAYIKIDQIINNAPAPGRRRVGMAVNNAQTTTGMDELNAAEAPVKTVIDGKMYIIRGEHMFDATGRMVK